MKMLRVGLVASNFLEAPNGGGADGNQQPASSSSLRERCGGRGINLHAAPNDSRAVALRTREHLAELHQAQPATLWCAKGDRISQIYEAVTNGGGPDLSAT